MGDPRKEVESIFAAVREFYQQPWVQEMYRREAREIARKQAIEDAALAKAKAEKAAEVARAKSYDIYVLNGGEDECMAFGVRSGCRQDCPVFQRRECEQQEEVEQMLGVVP